MKIKLTQHQILQIAANAVNAAIPVGMGMLHYQEKEYSPGEMTGNLHDTGLKIDYFDGRMTKLYIHREGDEWSFPENEPQRDYQSWSSKYPTYQALIDSVTGEKS